MKIITALLIIFTTTCFAEVAPYQNEIDGFFKSLEVNKPAQALDDLFKSNPWIKNNSDPIKQLELKFGNVVSMVGEYCGYDYLCETMIKDRLVHITYLAYYERQPLKVTFTFYKPKDTWRVQSFSYYDDFLEEIKNMSKDKLQQMD